MKKESTATNSYSAQYKHPNWQKKRLEILERDKFACARCGDKESTLHVHHTGYTKGCKVWEYSNHKLITFCDTCHEKVHKMMDDINWLIEGAVSDYRYDNKDVLKQVLDFLTIIHVTDDEDKFRQMVLGQVELFFASRNAVEEVRKEYDDA